MLWKLLQKTKSFFSVSIEDKKLLASVSLEGLSTSSTQVPSLTSASSPKTMKADNGSGVIDESTKEELFHTLVASTSSLSQNSHLQLNKETRFVSYIFKSRFWIENYDCYSCMEMVIIRATIGCQHHDSRLHIGKPLFSMTCETLVVDTWSTKWLSFSWRKRWLLCAHLARLAFGTLQCATSFHRRLSRFLIKKYGAL